MSRLFRPKGPLAAFVATLMMVGLLAAPAAHADASFSCHFAGDNQAYTCALPVTSVADQVTTYTLKVPVNAGVSVQTGSVPMTDADNQPSGVMTVTETASGVYEVKLAFSDAYLATHPNELQVYASFAGRIDTYSVKGPWTFDVNGVTSTLVSPDGVYCDTECREKPLPDGAHKATWNNGNGTIGANVWAGPDLVGQGQDITLSDSVGAGQTDCNASLSTVNKGVYTKVQDVAFNGSTATITWKWSQQPDGTALVLGVTCKVSGPGVYTDTGYVNGTELQRSVQVLSAGAGGEGTAPKPVFPTEHVTVIPGTPGTPGTPDVYKTPVVRKVAQHDTYLYYYKKGSWVLLSALEPRQREDFCGRYTKTTCKVVANVPFSKAQRAALNKARTADKARGTLLYRKGSADPRWWGSTTSTFVNANVCSTAKAPTNVDDWFLGKGATARAPWGTKGNVVQLVASKTGVSCKPILVKKGTPATPAIPAKRVVSYVCPDGTKVATATTQCKVG